MESEASTPSLWYKETRNSLQALTSLKWGTTESHFSHNQHRSKEDAIQSHETDPLLPFQVLPPSFQLRWYQAKTNTINLEDVTEDIFHYLLRYIYFQQPTTDGTASPSKALPDTATEIVHLFMFAKKYDTIELRWLCIHKFLGITEYGRKWPESAEHDPVLRLVFECLPTPRDCIACWKTTRFTIPAYTQEWILEWLGTVPSSVVARKLVYEKTTESDSFKILDPCEHHEHEKEEDWKSCNWRKREAKEGEA